jgi:FixJ family two-component response regulator
VVRVMLTGHADIDTALEAVHDGRIWRFLTKPWDEQDLNVTLRLAADKLDAERRNRALLADLDDPC